MQQPNTVRVTIRKSFAHRTGAPVQLTGVILAETPRAIHVAGHATSDRQVTWSGWIPLSCASVTRTDEDADTLRRHAERDAILADDARTGDDWAEYFLDLAHELTTLKAAAAQPIIPAHGVVVRLTDDAIIVTGDGAARSVPRTAHAAYDLVKAYPKAEVDADVYKAAAVWQKHIAAAQAVPAF